MFFIIFWFYKVGEVLDIIDCFEGRVRMEAAPNGGESYSKVTTMMFPDSLRTSLIAE